MIQEPMKEADCHPKIKRNSSTQVKNQEIFSISSSNLNYPSKKPCMSGCSHTPNSHLKHSLPPPPHQQKDPTYSLTDNEKKIKIVRDITERKSEICLNEQTFAVPSLSELNNLYLKHLEDKNKYNASSNILGKCTCQTNCDSNENNKRPQLKLNNISNHKLPETPFDFDPHKNCSYSCHSPIKVDLEKPNNFCKNILFQGEDPISSNYCDMFNLMNRLKIYLDYFLKKKLLLICVVAVTFFMFGVGIQFYSTFHFSNTSKSEYASLKGMRPHYVKKANRDSKDVDSKDVLDSLFISVKTTQKYHYPRVIVQLETWAALVKEQVSIFDTRLNYIIKFMP